MRWRGWASAPAPTRPRWPMPASTAGACSRRAGSSLPPASSYPAPQDRPRDDGQGRAAHPGVGSRRRRPSPASACCASTPARSRARAGPRRSSSSPSSTCRPSTVVGVETQRRGSQAGEADLGRRQAGGCQRRRHQRRVPAADRRRPQLRRRPAAQALRRRAEEPVLVALGWQRARSQRRCSTCSFGQLDGFPHCPRSSVAGGSPRRCTRVGEPHVLPTTRSLGPARKGLRGQRVTGHTRRVRPMAPTRPLASAAGYACAGLVRSPQRPQVVIHA